MWHGLGAAAVPHTCAVLSDSYRQTLRRRLVSRSCQALESSPLFPQPGLDVHPLTWDTTYTSQTPN